MKVSVETTSNLGRKVTVAIPSADVEAKKKEKIKKVASTMKIDGFRKGKIPTSFLQQKYSKQIHGDAVVELIESSLQNALRQEKLVPVDVPAVEAITDEHGKDLQYTAKFEIFPEIELQDFSSIELSRFIADITAEDIDKGIESLQEQFATWKAVDKTAAEGDKLIIDFVGSIDGVPFKGGDGKNVPIEIGAKKFIPGFEEGLVGAKMGEERDLFVTFPEEYGVAELAGKPAKFATAIHSIESKELATVDEEFAKKIGIQDGDVAKIRDKIKTNMEGYLASIVQEDLRNQVADKLIEINKFDIPNALVEKEKTAILENRKDQEVDMVKLEEDAMKKIQLGLILNKVISKHNLQPDEARIKNKIMELSSMFGGNVDLIKRIYKDSDKLLANVKNSVLTDQALDLAIEYATKQDISSTFYDIANRST
jgi:trigger factor